jgi:uncharacterized protein
MTSVKNSGGGGTRLLLWELFTQLRRRRFPLGPEDFYALEQALRAGHGWTSRGSLRNLCCSLWAKTRNEREILISLFNQLDLPDWELPRQKSPSSPDIEDAGASVDAPPVPEPALPSDGPPPAADEGGQEPLATVQVQRGLPPINIDIPSLSERLFVFIPQFPLTYREVAQAWRHLRRPTRSGPPVELDIDQTIAQRCRRGTASPVVLSPRRRNTARLLLLVDRLGSMEPFHQFVDEVCAAVMQSGRLESVGLFYFRNVPAEGADESVLAPVAGELFPTFDALLTEVAPLSEGFVYRDPELLDPLPLSDVLEKHAAGAAVVLVSDAGAARKHYNVSRLLDTIAFMKALRKYTAHYVWLNPLPRGYWQGSTASQIARHVPMFPLDRRGVYQAVNILRGQPSTTERPV